MWDIAFVGLVLVLSGATVALIRFCGKLMEGKR